MATALGLATSIVTLADVAQRLYKFAAKIKSAQTNLLRLSQDADALSMLCTILEKVLKGADGSLDSLTITVKSREYHAIPFFNNELKSICDELRELLDSLEQRQVSQTWRKWFRSLQILSKSTHFVLREDRIQDLVTRTGQAQWRLNTVLAMAILKNTIDPKIPNWKDSLQEALDESTKALKTIDKKLEDQFSSFQEQIQNTQQGNEGVKNVDHQDQSSARSLARTRRFTIKSRNRRASIGPLMKNNSNSLAAASNQSFALPHESISSPQTLYGDLFQDDSEKVDAPVSTTICASFAQINNQSPEEDVSQGELNELSTQFNPEASCALSVGPVDERSTKELIIRTHEERKLGGDDPSQHEGFHEQREKAEENDSLANPTQPHKNRSHQGARSEENGNLGNLSQFLNGDLGIEGLISEEYVVAENGNVLLLFGSVGWDSDGRIGPADSRLSSRAINSTDVHQGTWTSRQFANQDQSHCKNEGIDGNDTPKKLSIQMKVSSATLTARSRVFQARLHKYAVPESLALRNGFIRIALPDDDAQAFLVIMNVLHGNATEVPTNIDLMTLSRVAMLVHKYDFHEAMDIQARAWIEFLKPAIPTSLADELLPWIWISWVFDLKHEFKALTGVAQKESTGPIDEGNIYNVPVPSSVITGIESRRKQSISSIYLFLTSQLEHVKPGTPSQQHHKMADFWLLHAFKLGLIQHLGAMLGIFGDGQVSEQNYVGVSMKSLSAKVRDMTHIDDWCVSVPALESKMHPSVSMLAGFVPLVSVMVHSPRATIQGGLPIVQRVLEHIELLEKEDWGLDLEGLQS